MSNNYVKNRLKHRNQINFQAKNGKSKHIVEELNRIDVNKEKGLQTSFKISHVKQRGI